MSLLIYLDYAATTPLDPKVAEKMTQFLMLDGTFGNPASMHVHGKAARKAVDFAREAVAECIGATADEIIWTSGATEANNLALKGAAQLYQQKGKHIVTLKTEHPSVLDCCQQLEKQGFFVTYLTPEKNGRLNLETFQASLRPDTILVSVMAVNNETGVMQDLQKIAEITAEKNILLHVDAAQAVGKMKLNMQKTPIDLMSVCAHKVYGPKGIGALYIRRKPRVRVAAQMHGGGQENGMRSGTLPVHQIVGMGEAFALAHLKLHADTQHVLQLRHEFWQILKTLPHLFLNTDLDVAVPHILNIRKTNISSEYWMQNLPLLSFSSGSACHAKGNEPSYVLRAMGQTAEEAACGVRFSLGRFTTRSAIEHALKQIFSVFSS